MAYVGGKRAFFVNFALREDVRRPPEAAAFTIPSDWTEPARMRTGKGAERLCPQPRRCASTASASASDRPRACSSTIR